MCWVMPPASLSTDVGVAKRVEELGLAVVDVTHDGDHRRPEGEVGLVALVLTELEVERLEQLAVLVLGRDDLDDVVELLTEQLERRVVDRLGRGHHLAEAEQHLHELGRVDADPVGEVGQRGTAGQPDGLAVALADAHAADRRGLHGLELLTTGPLRLAATARGTAGATEGTLGLSHAGRDGPPPGRPPPLGPKPPPDATGGTGAGAGRATATGRATASGSTGTAGTTGAAGATATGATGATATGTAAEGGRRLGHHRRVGTRHAGAALGRRARRTLPLGDGVAACGLGAGTRRGAAAHALAGRERVVARTRSAGSADRPRGRGLGRLGAGLGGRRLGLGRRLRCDRGHGRRSAAAGASTSGAGSAGASTASGSASATFLAAAFLAGAFLAAGFSSAGAAGAEVSATDFSWSPYSFLNLISTGSSIVEEGDLTNSPISFNFSRTNLLSTL